MTSYDTAMARLALWREIALGAREDLKQERIGHADLAQAQINLITDLQQRLDIAERRLAEALEREEGLLERLRGGPVPGGVARWLEARD